MIPSEDYRSEVTREIRTAFGRVNALINRMSDDLQVLFDIVDRLLYVSELVLAMPSNSSHICDSVNGQQHARGIKRHLDDDSDESEIPNKISKPNDDAEDDNVNGPPSPHDVQIVAVDQCRLPMDIFGTNIDRSKTVENLHKWLAQVYNETAKFYTIKRCSEIGTFVLYIAIDVTLNETKDDIHVIINSDELQRPDAIFQSIERCFQERKVVTILQIITDDPSKVRENVGRLTEIVRIMMEPIVVHL